MNNDSKIFIAGHTGLVGSALTRKLRQEGFSNLILKSRAELDLLNQKEVNAFFDLEKPEYVFLAAAKVGGIMANKLYPADFVYQNLEIQNNIIENSFKHNVKKLLFLGSSCIYPRLCPQPIKEEYFMTSELEPTNIGYAIAKVAGIIACQSYNKQYGTNFISVMPTNLYGPNDNFDLNSSHVLPALIRRFHKAKENNSQFIELWGTGSAKREFLHVDDLADACLFLMENYDDSEIINIGTGIDLSIKELAEKIARIVDFNGELKWDDSKPDGMPRKLLEVSRIHNAGWKHKINLDDGLKLTYSWYLDNISNDKTNEK